MIDITQIMNAGVATEATNNTGNNDLNKDAFLKLLLTQMTNQNPLEPMNNTEFLAQLAQFSSLEQMQNISGGIEKLAQSQTIATNSQLINLLGKRVVVPGNQFTLNKETPVGLRFDIPPDSELPAYLQIKDKTGNVVRVIELENITSGANSFLFDGKDQTGDWMNSGNYQFSLLSRSNKELPYSTYSNVVVDGVSFESFGIMLKSNNTLVNFEKIIEIKSPLGGI
jgi:flagellar basal-body rod modification protein FlgD